MFGIVPRSSTCRRIAVALVDMQDVIVWKIFEQLCARGAVCDLPSIEHEGEPAALSVRSATGLWRRLAGLC
jgi:hypothetical protein